MFRVTLTVDIAIEEWLVAKALEPRRRAKFASPFRTPEAVAKHLGLYLVQGAEVYELAGFSDSPPDAAVVSDVVATKAVELRKGARRS